MKLQILQQQKLNKRIIAGLMSVVLSLGMVYITPQEACAKDKVLTLDAAKKLIEENSDKLFALEGKVSTAEAAYKSAVKSVALKKKNLSTFRWSPLLSFKFPQSPDFSESFEFTMKPVQASSAIDVAKHAYADQYFAEYETVYTSFVKIVGLQDKIDFNNQRLALMEDTLKKNKARWLMGEASEQDIKNMENSVKSLNSTIASDTSKLLSEKQKLSGKLGVDVATGYIFVNPSVEVNIPFTALDALTEATLDNDQNYYAACEAATVACLTLKVDKNLVKNKYSSSDYNIISGYVEQALNGQKISQRGFKSAYTNFLTAIDRYWQGKKKIFLFIKIPREWLRGDLDGVRYIEDDPYALYDAALNYQDALNSKKSAEKELREQVKGGFESVASMGKVYRNNLQAVEEAKEDMKRDAILNKVGKLSYDEFASAQESYANLQQDTLASLGDYSATLYSFDRLTCGAVSSYISGTGASMFPVGSGVSTIEDENQVGANYYISLVASQNVFDLNLNIPESMNCTATHFALIVDGEQIGDKTLITGKLRHLGLDLENVKEAKIRLYEGDNVLCDCIIDPEVYSGSLDIVTDFKISSAEDTDMGTYSVNTEYGISTITFKVPAGSKAKFIKLRTADNKYLGEAEYIDLSKEFIYPGVMGQGMDSLTIEYYDQEQSKLYEGYFEVGKGKLKRLTEN